MARDNKIPVVEIDKKKFKGLYAETNINGEKVILLEPQTYMNLSGESVSALMRYFKIPLENLVVIYDDLALQKTVRESPFLQVWDGSTAKFFLLFFKALLKVFLSYCI